MDTKTFIGGLTIGGLLCLMPISWYFGKDGLITSACFGLIGTISGTLIGFTFAGVKNADP